jgi:hypothetical protein
MLIFFIETTRPDVLLSFILYPLVFNVVFDHGCHIATCCYATEKIASR